MKTEFTLEGIARVLQKEKEAIALFRLNPSPLTRAGAEAASFESSLHLLASKGDAEAIKLLQSRTR